MEDLRKNCEPTDRRPEVSERAELENLVHRFNKAEEQENMKNLLFGAAHLSRSKDVESK